MRAPSALSPATPPMARFSEAPLVPSSPHLQPQLLLESPLMAHRMSPQVLTTFPPVVFHTQHLCCYLFPDPQLGPHP